MWNGALTPYIMKAQESKPEPEDNKCDHGNTRVELVGPDFFNQYEVWVEFNHYCHPHKPAPSNSRLYRFPIEFPYLEFKTKESFEHAMSEMKESERLRWVSNYLVWSDAEQIA